MSPVPSIGDCLVWNITESFVFESSATVNSCSFARKDEIETCGGGGPVTMETRPDPEFKWIFLCLGLLIAATASGNLMVCVAVFYERTLQNMSNYFLTSLAVADFLVAIFIMPTGLVVLVFGYFPLRPSLCVIWASLDVVMCTASIWHMCTLSIDRYLTLRYPMRYGRTRSRATMILKITAVWVISVLVCSPLTVSGFVDYSNVYANHTCAPSMKHFVLYGSVMAFYVPLVIMLITYTLTVNILRRNHRLMKLLTLNCSSSRRQRHRPLRKWSSSTAAAGGGGTTSAAFSRNSFLRPGGGSPAAIVVNPLGDHSGVLDAATSVSYLTAASSTTHTGSRPIAVDQASMEGTAQGWMEAAAAAGERGVASAAGSSALRPPPQGKERQAVSCLSVAAAAAQCQSSRALPPGRRQRRFSRSLTSLSPNFGAGIGSTRADDNPLGTWTSGGSVRERHHHHHHHSTIAKSISELESVRNFDVLSAAASLNSMPPSNSTWSSASWNDQATFERLSLIEAEMDECLMESEELDARTADLNNRKSTNEEEFDREEELGLIWSQQEIASSQIDHGGDGYSPRSLKGDTGVKNLFFPPTSVGNSPTPTQLTVGGEDTNTKRTEEMEDRSSRMINAISLKRESVSVPVNLCAAEITNNKTNFCNKKSLNGLTLRNDTLSTRNENVNNGQHKNTRIHSNLFANNSRVVSGSYELGGRLTNRTERQHAKGYDSDTGLANLVDFVSKSIGAQMKLVNVLSFCKSIQNRFSPRESSLKTATKDRLTDNRQTMETRNLSHSSNLDSGGGGGVEIARNISIILTSETAGGSSSPPAIEAELLHATNNHAESSGTDSVRLNCQRTSQANHLSASNATDRSNLPTDKVTSKGAASATDWDFQSIPPVTISSPDDRNSPNQSETPRSKLDDLEAACPDAKLKIEPKIESNALLPSSSDQIVLTNLIRNDLNLGGHHRKSPDFLTVQMFQRRSDCDPDASSTSGRTSWMESNSSISEDSEVIVRTSFQFRDAKRISSNISAFSETSRAFCCLPLPRRPSRRRTGPEDKPTATRTNSGEGVEIILSKKVSRNERKASKVLGIILLAFVVFWTPFFLVNILSVVCRSCDLWLSQTLTTYVVWWGYASSLANPVIYTLFSKSFRTAFRRILTCRHRSTRMKRKGTGRHRDGHGSIF